MMHFSLFCVFLLCCACHVVIGVGKNPTCEVNEVYVDDPNSSICQDTCSNRNKVCVKAPVTTNVKNKPTYAHKGCACEVVNFRSNDGACIKHDGPTCMGFDGKCAKNEIFSDPSHPTKCISCEKTCISRNLACKAGCQTGCYCQPEFFRNAKNLCVSAADCEESNEVPSCVGKNEIYIEIPKYKTCQRTCSNPTKECVKNDLGFKGCTCKKNFYRNKAFECVRYDSCETGDTCGDNEEKRTVSATDPTTCKKDCEKTCRIRNGTCNDDCKTGCYCKAEYYRDAKNKCVKKEECDTPDESTINTLTHEFDMKDVQIKGSISFSNV